MSVKGVTINKNVPGVGVRSTPDSTSALILNGVAVADRLALGTVYRLKGIRDALNLGLSEAYDLANKALVYYHIKEFYEMTAADQSGATLFLMVVPQTVTLPEMVEDTDDIYGKLLLNEAKGEVKQIAFAYNPTAYLPTQLNGLDADVLEAIPLAQGLADYAFQSMMPCQVLLEGKSFSGTVSAAQDLRNIANVSAPKVSVVIGQDFLQAEKDALFHKHAAVGTALGSVAARKVNENIGWVLVGNLTDARKKRWLQAGLSSHQPIGDYKESWQDLDDKGYIFPQTYANLDGVYWNGDHTCVTATKDDDGNLNEASVSFGRTVDKAARAVYAALLPSVKSPQAVDPDTGKLPVGVITYFQGLAETKLDRDMVGTNEISGRQVFVDPDSDLILPPKQLNVGVKVVPYGSADSIVVNLSLNATI